MLSIKAINDSVYGSVELHEFAEIIVDTPDFQRLRGLKQLDLCCLVFPSASHTRFEHSIGTYHLANLLSRRLQEQLRTEFKQLEVEFTDDECLCVSLASLCYNLGHGPFSHVWENVYGSEGFCHRQMGVRIFNDIVEDATKSERADKLKARRKFKDFMEKIMPGHQLAPDGEEITAKQLIASLITGGPDELPPAKQFIYEIVRNRRTGFDVDKWDSVNRDSHHLGLSNKWDVSRQLATLIVARVAFNGQQRFVLALIDSQMLDYLEMLRMHMLNRFVGCQHPKVVAFEKMIEDCLQSARKYLPNAVKPSIQVRRMILEEPATLHILKQLSDERLCIVLRCYCGVEARELMERIDRRLSYRQLATMRIILENFESEEAQIRAREEHERRLKLAEIAASDWNSDADNGDWPVELSSIDYGSGSRHPMELAFCHSERRINGQTATQFKKGDYLYPEVVLNKLQVSLIRLYSRSVIGVSESDELAKSKFVEKFSKFEFAEIIE